MKSIVCLLIALSLTGCGYQGWVRYPCQEYENWQKAECQPPQCEALGQCTKDLLPEVDTANG
jgi:predicted small lipoprotein YifL